MGGSYHTTMITKLNIVGMSCNHCVQAVEKALGTVSEVEHVEVNLKQEWATIQGKADPEALVAAVVEAGYQAKVNDHA